MSSLERLALTNTFDKPRAFALCRRGPDSEPLRIGHASIPSKHLAVFSTRFISWIHWDARRIFFLVNKQQPDKIRPWRDEQISVADKRRNCFHGGSSNQRVVVKEKTRRPEKSMMVENGGRRGGERKEKSPVTTSDFDEPEEATEA
ncbi:hypothetical protein Droror1_Dr00015733 [Drosera rotundifolia]